jgi:hypothetical protein
VPLLARGLRLKLRGPAPATRSSAA